MSAHTLATTIPEDIKNSIQVIESAITVFDEVDWCKGFLNEYDSDGNMVASCAYGAILKGAHEKETELLPLLNLLDQYFVDEKPEILTAAEELEEYAIVYWNDKIPHRAKTEIGKRKVIIGLNEIHKYMEKKHLEYKTKYPNL